jgi:hypothetical protein
MNQVGTAVRLLYKRGVTGSIPVAPTTKDQARAVGAGLMQLLPRSFDRDLSVVMGAGP